MNDINYISVKISPNFIFVVSTPADETKVTNVSEVTPVSINTKKAVNLGIDCKKHKHHSGCLQNLGKECKKSSDVTPLPLTKKSHQDEIVGLHNHARAYVTLKKNILYFFN